MLSLTDCWCKYYSANSRLRLCGLWQPSGCFKSSPCSENQRHTGPDGQGEFGTCTCACLCIFVMLANISLGLCFFLPLFFNVCTLVSTVCWGMTLDRSHDLSWQAVLPVTPFTFTVETRCHISLCQITCQCNTLPTLLYTLYRILPGTLLLLGICSCYLYIVISAAVLCYSSTLSVEAFSSLCGQLKVKHTRIFLHNICDFSHSGLMSSSPFPFTCMLRVIEFTV